MPLKWYTMTMAQIPKGPACRKCDFFVKIITDVGIIKLFSWQPASTNYECIFSKKIKEKAYIQKAYIHFRP